jgi:hypothetical protein
MRRLDKAGERLKKRFFPVPDGPRTHVGRRFESEHPGKNLEIVHDVRGDGHSILLALNGGEICARRLQNRLVTVIVSAETAAAQSTSGCSTSAIAPSRFCG